MAMTVAFNAMCMLLVVIILVGSISNVPSTMMVQVNIMSGTSVAIGLQRISFPLWGASQEVSLSIKIGSEHSFQTATILIHMSLMAQLCSMTGCVIRISGQRRIYKLLLATA